MVCGYDLDGDGVVPITETADSATAYAKAFPYPAEGMGCKSVCIGYEVMNNLTFDTNGDGGITEADEYWNAGLGWESIGSPDNPFTATFDGNGHTIANLFVSRLNKPSAYYVGPVWRDLFYCDCAKCWFNARQH